MHTLRYRTVSKNRRVVLPGAARKSADVGSDKIIVLAFYAVALQMTELRHGTVAARPWGGPM